MICDGRFRFWLGLGTFAFDDIVLAKVTSGPADTPTPTASSSIPLTPHFHTSHYQHIKEVGSIVKRTR